MAINRCQYWSVYEPPQCTHWDEAASVCTFIDEESSVKPNYYPRCNLIGTATICDHYESTAAGTPIPRCILPDPFRHVCNRKTGKKWITPTSSGGALSPIDFSPINGYNEGLCDSAGTDTTCSGYSPQHMGFGRLVPSDSGTRDIYTNATYSKLDEFDVRLPLHFVVFNLRARLSKCMHWSDSYTPFTINSDTQLVELSAAWSCSNENDTSAYSDFSVENGAPCNGCKPECPYYSGVCWEYCIDELLQSGDPILAEQVHELRYYCRENQWTSKAMESYFSDQGCIYTWGGRHYVDNGAAVLSGEVSYTLGVDNTIEEYQIASVKTYIDDFDEFIVNHDNLVLTKGTVVGGELQNFPDKVSEFSIIQLGPIIKNRFEVENVFEVSSFEDSSILLYGKVFVPGDTFVINISHIDLVSAVPSELFAFDSLLDIKDYYGLTGYNEFLLRYEKAISVLKSVAVNEKSSNKLSAVENTSFILEAPLYSKTKLNGGINTLVVFQDSSDGLLFSKISITKRVVGGVLYQSKFSIQGDNVPLQIPFDYTQGFNAFINETPNGIDFDFCSFVSDGHSYGLTHYYDDSSFSSADGEASYRGFKTYKIFKAEYYLSSTSSSSGDVCEYTQLGSDGYVLIKINHLGLNRIFQPWEFESIMINYQDGSSCEMEKVYSGAEEAFLEVNQLIVKPKNKSDFKSVCSAAIVIKDLAYYMRFSFDEEPDVSGWSHEVSDFNEEINYKKVTYDYSLSNNSVSITNFQFIMVPSVIIANSAGRDFVLFRTKPLGWVKQPQSPAVEILYSWSANYIDWKLSPICTCCGNVTEVSAQPSGYFLAPPCGDHDIGGFSGYGPVWWPFTACESYTTYNVISNLDNYSFDVVGLFKQETDDGVKLHGDHDMRMLGPANHMAYHGRGCNFLMACRCNWRTSNAHKNGDNYFSGYGRIRAGVPSYELAEWAAKGETLPKFGNSFRPLLESYRTLGKESYLKAVGEAWTSAWRLMPAFMGFNKADFLDTTGDYMWEYGASKIEGAPPVNNPLGFFTATSFENISINETLDSSNRFTLDEVCHANASVGGISYPNINGKYSSTKKNGKVYPWYEFKAYNASGGNATVQWAWQEKWRNLDRCTSEDQTKSEFIRAILSIEDATTIGPFVSDEDSGELVGYLYFLNVDYPSYQYNYKTEEFITTTSEDYHTIAFVAPEKDESTGEYDGPISFSLDGGPVRAVDLETLEWLEVGDEEFNIDLYSKCTGQEDPIMDGNKELCWFDEVTLFDGTYSSDKESAAESTGRMVKSYYIGYDEEEITKKLHYQNGLNVSINTSEFTGKNMPMNVLAVLANTNEQSDNNDEEAIDLICGMDATKSIVINFDAKVKTIASLEISYSCGAEEVEASDDPEEDAVSYKYYHIPAVAIYSSNDGITKENLLFSRDYITFYLDSDSKNDVETVTYSWDNTLDYIYNGALYIIIDIRATPTEEELAGLVVSELAIYNSSINLVKYNIYEVYEAILTNAVEYIQTYERKYYVSYGASGDSPPQGTDPESVSTLFVRSLEKSTVYNKDGSSGIMGIDGSDANKFTTMSKVRGRILNEMYEDETSLTGGVWDMEDQQKKLFDKAVKNSNDVAVMQAIVPPSLASFLWEENIYFLPATILVLENTLPTELAEINKFEPMSGEGHSYIPNYQAGGEKCYLYCSDGDLSSFEYEYTCLDPEADTNYTGQGWDTAYHSFYWGTVNYLMRKEFADATIENVFGPLYGGSSAGKIWTSNNESTMLFYDLQPLYLAGVASSYSPPYNLEYLAQSMNWHNAYFDTAKYFQDDVEITGFK